MTADRDPAVGALLDQVLVDPPPPAFWDDLLTRLEAEAPPVAPTGAEDGHVVDLRQLPSTSHRRRDDQGHRRARVVAAVVGAAAAIVVAVMAAGLARHDGEDEVDVFDPPTPSITAPDVAPPVVDAPASAQQRAEAAVRRWIDAMYRLDADAAWAMVGPQSRESLGGRAVFDETFPPLQGDDMWGRLQIAEETTFSSVLLPGGETPDEEIWIVTVLGAFALPQPEDRLVLATPVRVRAGDVLVEPFVPGPALSLLPAVSSIGYIGYSPGADPISLHIDADVAGYVVAVNGVPVPLESLDRDADGAVVGYTPRQFGESTLTVAIRTPEGALAVQAAIVQVMGGM